MAKDKQSPSSMKSITLSGRDRDIVALFAMGVKQKDIANKLDISQQRVSQVVKTSGFKQVSPLVLEHQKQHMPQLMHQKAYEVLEYITPEKLEKANPKDLAMIHGILYDKHRLATGQTTSNHGILSIVKKIADNTQPGDTIDVKAEQVA